MVEIIAELMSCVDCVHLVAYDGVPDDRPDFRKHVYNRLGITPSQQLVMGDSEHDIEFTWRMCDCCGRKQGGARSQIVLIQE